MNKTWIEPGLLSIFRLYITVQWLLLILALCGLSDQPDVGAQVTVVMMLLSTTLLLLYLRVNILQRWLQRFYLPIAILLASVAPIIVRELAVLARIDNSILGQAAADESGILILWLFVPLLAVAAQYGFRAVIAFVIATAALEITIASQLVELGGPPLNITIEQEIFRALIFLAIGYIIAHLIREQRQQRERLRQANQQLAQFAVTLEQLAVSRERNRLARDLHDTLAHTLSAVAIQLEAVTTIWESSPEQAKAGILRIRDVTRSGLNETRLALQAMRRNPVEDLGLRLALHSLAEQAAERGGFQLTTYLPQHNVELPALTAQNVYRIAEEALNNVQRHANAEHVIVALHNGQKGFVLTIRDDGVGYEAGGKLPEGHFGVIGMRERAALCGGKLTIHSELGKGTAVQLKIEASS